VTAAKDPAIQELLMKLDLQQRCWIAVDHWEADLCAIGIAAKSQPRRLVYVSVYDKDEGNYDYECESPTGNAPGEYIVTARGENVDFERLLRVLEAHLEG
jgi:hypothetical protein